MLIGGNVARTEHSRILRAQEDFLSSKEIDKYLNLILESEEDRNVDTLKEIFKETVSGFIPEEKNIDVVSSQQNQQI